MTRHKYEYRIDLDSDHVGPRICRMVGQGKRVLEVGAGPGSITRLLKEQGRCRVTAVEVDKAAIRKLGEFCERVHQFDLNDPSWTAAVAAEGRFDVVVAADVLEHLYNPWITLRAMPQVLEDAGYMVVSLPHVGHQGLIAGLAAGHFEYRDWGLLDRTHIRFFSIEGMQRLFEDSGLKIVDAAFLTRAPELTEFAEDWARAPASLRQTLEQCSHGRIYQVVIKAVPQSALGHALRLSEMSMPPPSPLLPPDASFPTKSRIMVKLIGRRYLSQRTRARLSDVLLRLGIRL